VSRTLDWASVALRPVEARDLEKLNAWQNDPETRDLIMGFRGPVRLESTEDWIRNMTEQNLKTRAIFAIRRGGEIAGVAQLQMIDWVLRTAMLGVYVGDRENRGDGIGEIAVSLILDYGFRALDLHRIGLEVIASNGRAKGLYERLGFVREGVIRQAYQRGGRREDVELWGLLRDEWTFEPPPEAHRLTWTD
jgi:RimJ/RimL family protein N-acetyltransferase